MFSRVTEYSSSKKKQYTNRDMYIIVYIILCKYFRVSTEELVEFVFVHFIIELIETILTFVTNEIRFFFGLK